MSNSIFGRLFLPHKDSVSRVDKVDKELRPAVKDVPVIVQDPELVGKVKRSVGVEQPVDTTPVSDEPKQEIITRVRKPVGRPKSEKNSSEKMYSIRFYTRLPYEVYSSIKRCSFDEKKSMGDIVSEILIERFSEKK